MSDGTRFTSRPLSPSSPARPDPAAAAEIRVRRLDGEVPTALWDSLTAMLHRAYAAQIAIGLRPLAGRQTVEVTRRRCISGDTFIAERRTEAVGGKRSGHDNSILGMILLQEIEDAAFPAWFLRDDVAHFSLFGVEPAEQGHGIGARLLDTVEHRAKERGARELALSMAEPDVSLRDYYRRRGFRFVQHWRWPYTNYRSAILSRAL